VAILDAGRADLESRSSAPGDAGHDRAYATMRVRVDETRCRGHARCLTFAPDVFTWDDGTDQSVVPSGVDLSGQEEAVMLAAQNCPERAIDVEP